jgi:hypothetical protein
VSLVAPADGTREALRGLVDQLEGLGAEVSLTTATEPGSLVVELGDDALVTLRAADGQQLAVPALLARAEIDALVEAGIEALPPLVPVIGWVRRAARPEADTAIAAAVAERAALDPDLQVEVVGEDGAVPERLRDHPQVRVRAALPDPRELAGWSTAIWSPAPGVPSQLDLIGLALAGVPVVVAGRDAARAGRVVRPELVVGPEDDAAGWARAVDAAVALDRAARRSMQDRAISLHGPDAAGAVARRLLGWLARRRVA